MRWAVLIALWLTALIPAAVGLVVIYALPEGRTVQGSASPLIPLAVAAVLAVLGLLAPPAGAHPGRKGRSRPSAARWLLLIVALALQILTVSVFIMAVFAPNLFGRQAPMIAPAVVFYLAASLVSAGLFFLMSRFNSDQRPNLMRWVAFWAGLYTFQWTASLALLLIYSVPGEPLATYPFQAGLACLAFLPFGLLGLGLAREHVRPAAEDRPVEPPPEREQ